jgi:hypothetical protein
LKIVRDFYSYQPLGPNPQSRPMTLFLFFLSYCLVRPSCFPPSSVCRCPAQPIWPACSLLFLYSMVHTGPMPAQPDSFVLMTPAEAEPSARAAACHAPLFVRCRTDLDSAHVRLHLARTPSSRVCTAITLILLLRAWSRIKMKETKNQIRIKFATNS